MTELQVFERELRALEDAGRFDAVEYDYLAGKVEELRAAEQAKAKPPAQQSAPTTEPEADSVAKLASDLQAAGRNPERYSDSQLAELVDRYNRAVVEAGERHAERIDVQQLSRDMAAAAADPNLDEATRDQLIERYNAAVRQGPERRSVEALRAELGGDDLPARMRAAVELQARGELDDATVDQVVNSYNEAVTAAAGRGADAIVDALPVELRDAARAVFKAQADLEVPPDPAEAAVHQLNAAIRSMKPPSLAEQLAALGIEPAVATEAQAGAAEQVSTTTSAEEA